MPDAGIGLKHEHVDQVHALSPPGCRDGLWFEVHTENYFTAGGPRLAQLAEIRQHYPVSFHGVGASLGSGQALDSRHLAQIKGLVDRFQPALVSEHAVWSQYGGTYFADLLPLPRTQDAAKRLVDGIDLYQNAIGRSILIENPTNYLHFVSDRDEPEFLVEIAQTAGCGLLLDVNNLYLSAHNCGIDAEAYIRALPPALVGEIHIAGHDPDDNLGTALLIDSHAAAVSAAVWQLLQTALAHLGPVPVLLERDANLPPFGELLAERDRAAELLAKANLTADRDVA